MTATGWIESYKNHILHCSIYMAVISSAVQFSSTLPHYTSLWNFFPILLGGLALLSLYNELHYIVKRAGLPPGDAGMPIFGCLVEILKHGPRTMKLEYFKKYQSSLVTFNILMRPVVAVKEEEDVRWWLIQERKGNVIPNLLPHVMRLLGPDAILVQHSTSHRRLRKIFEPSFSQSAVKGYVDMLDATTKTELDKWSSRQEFCSSNDWAILAMRLFFDCAFGRVEEEMLETLSRYFHIWADGFATPIPLALPGTQLYKSHAAKAKLTSILQRMVNDFKKAHPPPSSSDDNNNTPTNNSMMARLCYGVDDEGRPLSEVQLITNILFILFAGHDTTKGSFCAFAYYLTTHPKIESMLREEVSHFQEPLDMDELKNAPLLNAFMAETWRLVPPLSAHNVKTTVPLEYKGYKLGKGTSVSVDIQTYSVMNDENRYKDPWEFRLERWLPPGHALHNPKYFQKDVDYNVPSTKYRAFSMGAHMCLGAHFAKLEARIVLTRLLQHYDIEITNNQLRKAPLLQYQNDFKLTRRKG